MSNEFLRRVINVTRAARGTDPPGDNSWGDEPRISVHDAKSGRRFCYDVVVKYAEFGYTRRFYDLEDASTLFRRAWHWIFRRFR